MIKFENERIHNVQVQTELFEFPIPASYVEPKTQDESTCVFIYVCGLGGTNTFNLYMNSEAFDNNYFVTYEKAKHGDNKNKPSQFKKMYLNELDCIVDWAIKTFNNKKIYLLGESWGCAINFLYYEKYQNKIAGVINWNMPTKVVDPAKKSFKTKWKSGWRELVTILFNVDLDLPPDTNNTSVLSQNKLLIRAMAMMPETRHSSKLTLAVWRYMRPSYHFLLKHSTDPKFNFLYIQTGQDALMTKKHIDKIMSKADSQHFLKLETGFHILSMEPNESKILYQEILKFIKR